MLTEETDALQLTDETAECVLWKKPKLYMFLLYVCFACHMSREIYLHSASSQRCRHMTQDLFLLHF